VVGLFLDVAKAAMRLVAAGTLVFVLRNAFDLSFEEIAPVVRRDVVACRKIFSRARARIAQARSRFTVDRQRHRAQILGFREAARGQDMDALVSLLDDNVVPHGDGGGRAPALKKAIVGKMAVARFIIAVTRTLSSGATVEEMELNGAPGLVAKAGGRIVVAIVIDTDGACIHSVFAVSNPDKLDAIAPAVGREAVEAP
jgi:RNA polymerase sigma-70 factor, ECF subfamily